MNLQAYESKCRDLGIEYHWLPLRDKWIPIESSFFKKLINIWRILQTSDNEKMLVHCNGGRGRTALFAVCLLLLYNMSYRDAVEIVRSARPRMLRNPLQQLFCFHCWV